MSPPPTITQTVATKFCFKTDLKIVLILPRKLKQRTFVRSFFIKIAVDKDGKLFEAQSENFVEMFFGRLHGVRVASAENHPEGRFQPCHSERKG